MDARCCRMLLLALGALHLLSPTARAADAPPAFPKGLWTIELSGSYADPIRFSEDRFAFGTVGVNYYLADNLSLGLHLSGYAVDQPRDDGNGVGVEAFARLHLLTFDRFTLYIDGDAVAARSAVGRLAGVQSAEARGSELVVTATNGAATIGPVAVALEAEGIRLRDLTLRTPTLDDVFLELTGSHIHPNDETTEVTQ